MNKLRIRRSLFNLAESFSRGRQGISAGEYDNALVVYAATIGEFHPLMPVIDSYLKRNPNTPLIIFSGQTQYIKAMGNIYPNAAVGLLPPCAPWLYDRLFRRLKPRAVVLGEGPCLYLHFPISFDLALPMACIRHNTKLYVVNATLHQYHRVSKLNRIEDWLFGRSFLDAINYWFTPNEIFKGWLTGAGVPGERIVITGDLRFDNRRHLGSVSKELSSLLEHYKEIDCPIIVAGSVNAIDEEGPVIEGWLKLREQHGGARLIMAPRHVNNSANMEELYQFLSDRKIRFSRRSQGAEEAKAADVLVVDVFGELPHFYSIASTAYIGRNHGVLEPLRFRVPTVVAPREDWISTYVTYPAYQHMIDHECIIEAPSKQELGSIFCKIANDPTHGETYVENAERIAQKERKAGDLIVEQMTDEPSHV